MPKPPQPPEPRDPQPRSPAPSIDPVFLWPTPSKAEFLFFVERNGDLPANKGWAYGDSYRGRGQFPDHKLVYVSPQSADKWSRWFYASDRINEEAYNFEFSGDQLVRSYLVQREKYFARTAAQAAAAVPTVIGEFTVPEVATPDARFTKFGFADDTLGRTDTEMDSLYVVVRRRYIEPVTVERTYSDELEAYITITKTIVPVGTTVTDPPSVGRIEEIRHGNSFHDILITQTLDGWDDSGGLIDRQLATLPTFVNYPFPSRLDSVDIQFVAAWADSTEAARSYSEDYYFEYQITEPRPGPYPAIIERTITSNPASFVAGITLSGVPVPKRETVGIAYYWFFASTKGNQTQAVAKEIEIPSTIHDTITITINGTDIPASTATRLSTTTLTATTGFDLLDGNITLPIDADVRKLPFQLYEVRVTKLNITGGIYD
jgi:hypothetical protein